MSETLKFVEDGFAKIQIGDGPEIEVDLFRLNNELVAITNRNAPDVEQGQEITDPSTILKINNDTVDLFAGLGFGTMSHRLARQVKARIFEMCGELRKNDEPAQPSSPSQS